MTEPEAEQEMKRSILTLCAAAMAFVPLAASAHVGVGDAQGFVHGFSHPLTGIDHALAMIAVGLFAAHLGGRAMWLVPLTFVTVMGLAGITGMAAIELPFVETGIGISVVVLGLAVASRVSVPTLCAAALVGFFAIFHGHAHGTEMPETMSGLSYGLGFVCATALLHVIGVGLGIAMARKGQVYSRRIAQVSGTAMAIAGLIMVTVR